MKPIVSYLRVSTAGQGKSGLGLDAQREANQAFAAANGFEIIAEYQPPPWLTRSATVARSWSPSWTACPEMCISFPA
jgi:hypothetical protein